MLLTILSEVKSERVWDYLLLEDGDDILLETSDKQILN